MNEEMVFEKNTEKNEIGECRICQAPEPAPLEFTTIDNYIYCDRHAAHGIQIMKDCGRELS